MQYNRNTQHVNQCVPLAGGGTHVSCFLQLRLLGFSHDPLGIYRPEVMVGCVLASVANNGFSNSVCIFVLCDVSIVVCKECACGQFINSK